MKPDAFWFDFLADEALFNLYLDHDIEDSETYLSYEACDAIKLFLLPRFTK